MSSAQCYAADYEWDLRILFYKQASLLLWITDIYCIIKSCIMCSCVCNIYILCSLYCTSNNQTKVKITFIVNMMIKQDYNWVVTVTEYWRDISYWNNEATTSGVESFSWLIKKSIKFGRGKWRFIIINIKINQLTLKLLHTAWQDLRVISRERRKKGRRGNWCRLILQRTVSQSFFPPSI